MAGAALAQANARLGGHQGELEHVNKQLQENAAQLEAQAEELQSTGTERERLLAQVQGANAELRRLATLAQEAERRARFLEELGQALQPVAEPDAVMETTARLLGEHLGADRCAYAEAEADEDTFTITGNYTRGDTQSIVGRFTFRAFGAEVLRLPSSACHCTRPDASWPRWPCTSGGRRLKQRSARPRRRTRRRPRSSRP